MLSLETIRELIIPYGVTLDDHVAEQIRAYLSLLLMWNKKISLTALDDPTEIIKLHFGESIAAINLGPITGRLADVGTGAGFPGLPLKLISPSIDLVLIEPNQKKCTFLHEVLRTLNLSNVEIFRGRFEDFPLPGQPASDPAPAAVVRVSQDSSSSHAFDPPASAVAPLSTLSSPLHASDTPRSSVVPFFSSHAFHTITSRALPRSPALLSFASHSLLPSGRLLLWLTLSDAHTLTSSLSPLATPSLHFHPPLPLPATHTRIILTSSLSP